MVNLVGPMRLEDIYNGPKIDFICSTVNKKVKRERQGESKVQYFSTKKEIVKLT